MKTGAALVVLSAIAVGYGVAIVFDVASAVARRQWGDKKIYSESQRGGK